jgi:hypothetical protein
LANVFLALKGRHDDAHERRGHRGLRVH